MSLIAQKLISASGGVQEETDDDFSITTSLMHFDGSNNGNNSTFLDSSSESHTITNGSTPPSQGSFSPFSAEEGKWSIFFDGNGDYIDVGSSDATQLGSGDFTVEFWIKTSDTSCNIANPDSATGSGYWGLLVQSGDLRWNDSYNVSNKWVVDGAGILDDAWHHVAIVRNSGTFAVYYDGTSQSVQSGSFSDATDYSGSDGLRIGSGNLGYFKGFISNFRSVNGTAVYTSNYSAPSTPLTAITNTKVLVCCSNRYRDKSSTGHFVDRYGNVSIKPFSPFNPSQAYSASVNGGSAEFDQAGTTYLDITDSTDFDFGTGDFTVEAWVYPNKPLVTSTVPFALMLNGNGSNFYFGWTTYSLKGLVIYGGANIGSEYSGSIDHVPKMGGWSHIVYQRTSGTFNFYLNGTRVYNTADSGAFPDVTGVRVGVSEHYGNYYMGAFLSDLRIVKGSNVYSNASTLTLPTAPLTDVTNTKLLLNSTNAQMIDSTAKNNFETVGSVYLTSTVKQFGTTSCDLYGGTGSRVASSPNSVYNILNTGKFTVEFWLYVDSYHASYSDIVGVFNGVSLGWLIYQNGTYIEAYINGVQLQVARPSTATWTHIALTRDGTTTRLFKDGTSGATSTSSLGADQATYGLVFGGDATGRNGIDARIDEFRLTNGKARYTSNFTVPTEAFPNL